MLSLSFIKKERNKMKTFKDKMETTNLDILKDVDDFFDKHKNEGFKFKTLNRFFIDNGFSYDNDGKCFYYSAYNPSIDRNIDTYVYENSVMFECGLLTMTSIFEIRKDSTEEQARTKIMDYLLGCSDNFIEYIKEYAAAHGGKIDDKEDDVNE